ncbi:MAG: phenylalanine--tRNA ligase subunit beta, partial [Bdellovibrionales bacterium]|nr:phenylalanine--tRNA ligase subunit beta [Bdellovibrionales bacterium]
AEILSIRPHPEADKLRLATITLDGKEKSEVVCGAPNIQEGMRVPYAPIGTSFPNGLTLEPKKIRGVISNGMLCSQQELGIGDDASGIWALNKDAELGLSLSEYLKIEADAVFEIDNKSITHRPDLWSHIGIARELGAILKKPLNRKFDENWEKSVLKNIPNGKSPIEIDVDLDSSCVGYFGISVDGVSVMPSPAWMQARLKSAGLRPINNIVDIGNYVMLETGGPLHMFDREKIAGNKVLVKKITKDTSLKLLDESTAQLLKGDTVVADKDKPLVVGGIIGGEESGVSDATTKVFIEAASWNSGKIRKLSDRLAVRTDSSQRFEKGIHIVEQRKTILRALELLLEICPDAKVVGSFDYAGQDLSEQKQPLIETSVGKVSSLLGIDLKVDTIVEILNSLDFQLNANGEYLSVKVPFYRAIRGFVEEADIVEEVGRIVGYDQIEPKAPLMAVEPVSFTKEKKVEREVRDFLVLQGRSLEVLTYPLTGENTLKKYSWSNLNENLKIKNPVSKDRDRMRPSLTPHLLEAAELNSKTYDGFRIFEYGKVYLKENEIKEPFHLGVLFYSLEKNQYLEVANLLEKLFSTLGYPISFSKNSKKTTADSNIISANWIGTHPSEYQELSARGKTLGAICSVHPLLLKNLRVKGFVTLAELNLNPIIETGLQDKVKYQPPAKHPVSIFDCSVVAKQEDQASELI